MTIGVLLAVVVALVVGLIWTINYGSEERALLKKQVI